MERTLNLAHAAGQTAASVGIISAMDGGDIAISILVYAGAFNNVGTLEANFTAGSEAEEFLGRIFHEIITLNINLTAERHAVSTCFRILRVIFQLYHFGLTFGIVVNH